MLRLNIYDPTVQELTPLELDPPIYQLWARLTELDLSYSEVARRAEIHLDTVKDIFAGKRKPRIDTVCKLAGALGCQVVIEWDYTRVEGTDG